MYPTDGNINQGRAGTAKWLTYDPEKQTYEAFFRCGVCGMSDFCVVTEQMLEEAREAALPVVEWGCWLCAQFTVRLPIYNEGTMKGMFHVKHKEE